MQIQIHANKNRSYLFEIDKMRGSYEEAISNKHLITAAPDLLEALERSTLIVAREAERIAEAHRNAGHPKALNVTAKILEDIKAIIAKARP